MYCKCDKWWNVAQETINFVTQFEKYIVCYFKWLRRLDIDIREKKNFRAEGLQHSFSQGSSVCTLKRMTTVLCHVTVFAHETAMPVSSGYGALTREA